MRPCGTRPRPRVAMSCGRRRGRTSPFIVMVPPERGWMPDSALSSEVLPTPMVPMMQVTSPAFATKSMP